jgi:MinD-like ATPase involved in chromosome partitioning or flagellar assembly
METVAFYSYKGGVGRTLLVAETAVSLARSGRRVVALDLDLEAPGLHYKLGNQNLLCSAARGELRGTVDELLDTLENVHRNSSIQETAIQVELPRNAALFLIPAGSAPSRAYWAALERLNNSLRGHRRNGGLLEAVLELQARIADELAPDFLLVDSRTGITELGGLATSVLADRVVCLTTTAPESVEGIQVVADALRTAPRLASQQPLRIYFLITRVALGADAAHHVSRVAQALGGTVTVLPHDSGIANEEQVFSRSYGTFSTSDEPELFSTTLDWITRTFLGPE